MRGVIGGGHRRRQILPNPHHYGLETSIFTLGAANEEAANLSLPGFYPVQTSAAFPRYLRDLHNVRIVIRDVKCFPNSTARVCQI